MFKKLFFILLLFVNSFALAADEQDLKSVASSSDWVKLLRLSDDYPPSFYLASDPVHSPVAELTAHLRALKEDHSYPCRFPARARFLSNKFHISLNDCAEVRDWKKTIASDSVALVYVSQYVSNPASAFGHTFLLLQRKSLPPNLSVTISSAASMPEDVSAAAYIYNGLSGGFPAVFSYDAFYVKTQEYSNIENRDFWIYRLNFSEAQIDQLLNHLWELSHLASTKYFFLNQNCGVNNYNALAAVHPDLELIPTNQFFILPSETLPKILPVTASKEYRPSLREKIILMSRDLRPEERAEVKKVISQPVLIKQSSSLAVSELVLENFEYLRSQQAGHLSPSQEKDLHAALLHRASLGRKSEGTPPTPPTPPDRALSPARLAISGGGTPDQKIFSLSASPLFHGILEEPAGYLPSSELVLLELEAQRVSEASRLNLTLLRMANFPPITLIDSPWSWKVRVGGGSSTACSSCWTFLGDFGVGKSFEISDETRFFALAGASQDRVFALSPQLSLGGFSKALGLNFFYQVRALQNISDSKVKTYLELGAHLPLSRQMNLEIQRKIEDDQEIAQVVLGFHF